MTQHHPRSPLITRLLIGALVGILFSLIACKTPPAEERGKKVLHMALRSKVGDMDPISGGHAYASLAMAPVFETLFDYQYLKRPLELEPLLLESMPDISADGRVYTFTLRKGVFFHDDPCFPEGKGRELHAEDVIFSIKRMANRTFRPRGWWLYNDRIVGFNAYRDQQSARPAKTPFQYDAPVKGLKVLDRYRFRITLTQPYPQFLYVLAMNYTSVVAREAVEHYGQELSAHPVGTGPFTLKRWIRGTEVVFERNPRYRERQVYFPTEKDASPGMKERGLLRHAGELIPLLDGIVMHVFEQSQPMWLKWRVKDLDYIQVPAEYHDAIFQPDFTLREGFVKEGVQNLNVPLLDFIYRGFNMEHPITGGEQGKLIRQAISLAFDVREFNDAFYNNTCVEYDGPIPPGLEGYKPGVTSAYRGPNIEKARALLAKAGYPGGKGLPPIEYEISIGGNEQAEMFSRQLKEIGVTLQINSNSFPELVQKLSRRKAQFFGLAWGSDYPDAQNNLALFYGPNSSPGSNNFNYQNPAFDALYDRIKVMQPGPERTRLYLQMRELILEDVPTFGSMARTRFYVWNKRMSPVLPNETSYRWLKYTHVERQP